MGSKIYAYNFTDGSRDSAKDFELVNGNKSPTGIWSDGTTMWVANLTNKIFAYKMSDQTRDSAKDFNTLQGFSGDDSLHGIWSDRTTMYVSNYITDEVLGYSMSGKSLDTAKTFDLVSENSAPHGIWSDGTTMWVADADNTVYAYAYPSPPSSQSPSSSSAPFVFFIPPPPPDTTPPYTVSVERTGNATTADRALVWDVKFSESVAVSVEGGVNHTSVANATIPDLGMVADTIAVDGVPWEVSEGSIAVDLDHTILSSLLVELVAPDCTRFVVHNQTAVFSYQLSQPRDLGDLAGVDVAGNWTLEVSDRAKYWNGTLNGWSLSLESDGMAGRGTVHTIKQYVAGPGVYTLSLDGYDVRDGAGNPLDDAKPEVNEPYHVVGTIRTC